MRFRELSSVKKLLRFLPFLSETNIFALIRRFLGEVLFEDLSLFGDPLFLLSFPCEWFDCFIIAIADCGLDLGLGECSPWPCLRMCSIYFRKGSLFLSSCPKIALNTVENLRPVVVEISLIISVNIILFLSGELNK